MATTSMDYEATGERYDGKRTFCFIAVVGCALAACTRCQYPSPVLLIIATQLQMTAPATTATVAAVATATVIKAPTAIF